MPVVMCKRLVANGKPEKWVLPVLLNAAGRVRLAPNAALSGTGQNDYPKHSSLSPVSASTHSCAPRVDEAYRKRASKVD